MVRGSQLKLTLSKGGNLLVHRSEIDGLPLRLRASEAPMKSPDASVYPTLLSSALVLFPGIGNLAREAPG